MASNEIPYGYEKNDHPFVNGIDVAFISLQLIVFMAIAHKYLTLSEIS